MNTLFDQDFANLSALPGVINTHAFESCNFNSCNFENLDLSGKEFQDCTFTDCNLSLTNLSRTSFRVVTFRKSKMLGMRFDHCAPFLLEMTFDHCVLDHSSFVGLKMKKWHFDECSLREVDYTHADLSAALFAGSDLADAVFEQTNLEGADLRSAYNFRIEPEHNRMRHAKFSRDELAGLLEKYQLKIS